MTLRGSVADFPLETIVQLLAATAKTGQLEVRSGSDSGTLGFAKGRLVSAVSGDDKGEPALGAVFTLTGGDFEFVPWTDAPQGDLEGELDHLLDRAVEQRDKIVADRSLIPDDRVRFVLSDRAAAQGEVRLSSEQWRTLLAVNGQRDVRQIAEQLGIGRLAALAALAELVRAGIIALVEAPPEPPPPERGPGTSGEGGGSAFTSAPAASEPAPPPAPDRWSGLAAASETPSATAPAEPSWAAPAPTTTSWEQPAQTSSWEQPAETSSWERPVAAEPSWEAPAPADAWQAPATAEPEPAPLDDRLAALSGLFPAAPAPAPEPAVEPAWEPATDPRLVAMTPPASEAAPAWQPAPAPAPAWQPAAAAPVPAAPASGAEARAAEPATKKGGLLGGLFGKKDSPAAVSTDAATGSRATRLATFANALLDEFTNGTYEGKGRLDDRLANRLMRADEQADPIDRPLPVRGDRIDVAALERASFSDRQVSPYIALVISQLYEDAERAFGKDRAKRGYRSVQHAVLGDSAALGPDLRLPRV